MKGDAGVLEHLNKVLANELTAINQYFLHARMLTDWGLGILGAKEFEESVDEMRHAQMVIDRMLFLEGKPNMQDLGKICIGDTVERMLANDLALEMIAIPDLKTAIGHAEKVADFVSRDLFRQILDSEEDHVDWLETQLDLIKKVGIENYMQSQIGADEVAGA